MQLNAEREMTGPGVSRGDLWRGKSEAVEGSRPHARHAHDDLPVLASVSPW